MRCLVSVTRGRTDARPGWPTRRTSRRRRGCRRGVVVAAGSGRPAPGPAPRPRRGRRRAGRGAPVAAAGPTGHCGRTWSGACCTPMTQSPSTTMLCQSSSACTVPSSRPAQNALSAAMSAASNTTTRRMIFTRPPVAACVLSAAHADRGRGDAPHPRAQGAGRRCVSRKSRRRSPCSPAHAPTAVHAGLPRPSSPRRRASSRTAGASRTQSVPSSRRARSSCADRRAVRQSRGAPSAGRSPRAAVERQHRATAADVLRRRPAHRALGRADLRHDRRSWPTCAAAARAARRPLEPRAARRRSRAPRSI